MTINVHIEYHDCIKSTQDALRMRVQAGASEGLVIQAGEQTGGYGRHGRVWQSAPGNLYCSLLLKPDCAVKDVGQLAIVAGLSVGQAVRDLIKVPDDVMVKWPNDVLIKGQKCAGILIETDGAGHVLVGIGMNVEAAPHDTGVCIHDHSRESHSVDTVRDRVLARMQENYNRWVVGDFAAVKRDWLATAHPAGTPVCVKIGEHEVAGKFETLDDTGAMMMKVDGALKTITAGDVFFQTDPLPKK